MQVHVLGDLTLFIDGIRVGVPGSRKTRALLGYLLLQDRPVTREHLCEMLWPHPDNPRAALRWSLTKLRPVLNARHEHLSADRASVSVVGLDEAVDLRRIDAVAAKPIETVETADLEATAKLFHGELLEGLEIPDCHRYNEWLIARAEAARKSRRRILETLTARHAEDPEAALVHARARVALDPLDEGAHVDVVRLLGALGRLGEAEDQADRCRKILASELGVDPGPDLARAVGELTRVQAVPTAPDPVPRARPAATVDAGLFGRAEECARLERFIARKERRPRLILEGEPGIGKSRLLTELRRRAEARGILVLEGRSWEVESVRPFGVWIDLLEKLPHEFVPEDLRADLAPLMPSLGEAIRYPGDVERIRGAVRKLVDHFERSERTVIFLFDDLHWIDQSSAALLGAAVPQGANPHFGVACAGRPGEFADNEAARSLLRTWNREGRLERIRIAPLTDREAAALARTYAESDDVGPVVASCGGNPLYLIESMRDRSADNPGAVANLVGDRLAVLDEATREIADWAAVLGRSFPATRMADLLSRSADDLVRQAEVLERHGILHPHDDGWDFAHDLLRKAALGELSGPRRSLMHRRVARTIAEEPDPDGSLAGDIAFHAGRGNEPGLAARFSIAAGDRALRLAAFDDAWRIADRGLVEIAKLPSDTEIETHVELLRILVLAGMGRKRGEILTEQLAGLADRAGENGLHAAERTARWLLSVVTEESGDLEAARAHSLGAEKAGRAADPETRLQALANTARCLVQLEREPARAAALLEEARQLSDSLSLPVLDIPWGFGLLHAMEDRPAEARAALEQGVAMARDEDNHWALFECLSRLSMLDFTGGDLDAVEERDADLRVVADKLGEGSERALAATLLALARRKAGGDPAELEAALEDLRAADSKGLLAYALNEAGRLDLADGNAATALERAVEAHEAAGAVGREFQGARALRLNDRARERME